MFQPLQAKQKILFEKAIQAPAMIHNIFFFLGGVEFQIIAKFILPKIIIVISIIRTCDRKECRYYGLLPAYSMVVQALPIFSYYCIINWLKNPGIDSITRKKQKNK